MASQAIKALFILHFPRVYSQFPKIALREGLLELCSRDGFNRAMRRSPSRKFFRIPNSGMDDVSHNQSINWSINRLNQIVKSSINRPHSQNIPDCIPNPVFFFSLFTAIERWKSSENYFIQMSSISSITFSRWSRAISSSSWSWNTSPIRSTGRRFLSSIHFPLLSRILSVFFWLNKSQYWPRGAPKHAETDEIEKA